ncbi:MAG TPA: hypothetical protein VEF04_10955, partial [Blastocatellia bacterium]|nr:hypothetical protein [Blastocatellia bacterium]
MFRFKKMRSCVVGVINAGIIVLAFQLLTTIEAKYVQLGDKLVVPQTVHGRMKNMVAVAGNGLTALISAPSDLLYGVPNPGKVFVYTRDTVQDKQWTLQAKLKFHEERFPYNNFGAAVALSGDGS